MVYVCMEERLIGKAVALEEQQRYGTGKEMIAGAVGEV